MVTHEWDNPPFEHKVYNAEYAQKDAESQWSAKGPELKLGTDWALVQAVTHLIRNEHYSPYAVLAEFVFSQYRTKEKITGNPIGGADKKLDTCRALHFYCKHHIFSQWHWRHS